MSVSIQIFLALLLVLLYGTIKNKNVQSSVYFQQRNSV